MFATENNDPAPLSVLYDYVRQTGRYNMVIGETHAVHGAILALGAFLRQPLPWDAMADVATDDFFTCIRYAYKTFPDFATQAQRMAEGLPGGPAYVKAAERFVASEHRTLTMSGVLDEAIKECKRWTRWAREIERTEDETTDDVLYGAYRMAREGRLAPAMSKKQRASLRDYFLTATTT